MQPYKFCAPLQGANETPFLVSKPFPLIKNQAFHDKCVPLFKNQAFHDKCVPLFKNQASHYKCVPVFKN